MSDDAVRTLASLINSRSDALEKMVDKVCSEMKVLSGKLTPIENRMDKNEEAVVKSVARVVDLEGYGRRWNLRLHSLPEAEKEDVRAEVVHVCQQVLLAEKEKLPDAVDVAHRVHLSSAHREALWKAAKNNDSLHSKGLRFTEDLTKERETRERLWPRIKKAREEGKMAYFVGAKGFIFQGRSSLLTRDSLCCKGHKLLEITVGELRLVFSWNRTLSWSCDFEIQFVICSGVHISQPSCDPEVKHRPENEMRISRVPEGGAAAVCEGWSSRVMGVRRVESADRSERVEVACEPAGRDGADLRQNNIRSPPCSLAPAAEQWKTLRSSSPSRQHPNHLDKTTTWHDPRLTQLQSAAPPHPGPAPVHTHSLSNPATATVTPSCNPDAGGLPEGWERAATAEGDVYYIDHINKSTTWLHPRLGLLSLAMQQRKEKERLRCKQQMQVNTQDTSGGGRNQMSAAMDHDRSALAPSVDVRIRAPTHEPTLNGGAHSRNESTDSGLSVSSLPRSSDLALAASVDHMDTGECGGESSTLQDSMPAMSESEELMPCIPEGLTSDLLMDMETVLSGSHMDRDSLLTWL
ncbi:uncharacterized protein LOC144006810 [Festucalex cinctus]